MTRKLHSSVFLVASCAWLLACDVDDQGLQHGLLPGMGAPAPAPAPTPVPPAPVPPAPPVPDPVAPPAAPPPSIDPPPAVLPPPPPPPDTSPPPAPPPAQPPPPSCEIDGPVRISMRTAATPSGDLTFDSSGFLVLAQGRDIVRLARGGPAVPILENALEPGQTLYGVRVMPEGGLFFTDNESDLLIRYDARGRRTFTMDRPVQFVGGPGGSLYVTGVGGEIYRLDPQTGRTNVLARIQASLRGLTFSPDQKALYVTERDARTLRRFDVRPDGGLSAPEIVTRNLGQSPDGLTTDICGNVYVADRSGSPLLRVTPAGRVETLADLDTSLSAIAFGSGKQGWDPESLYAVSEQQGGLYEIRVGVRGPTLAEP